MGSRIRHFPAELVHTIHRNAVRGAEVYRAASLESSMTSIPNDTAIDEIVASCNGDIRGALRALLLVNEQLEAELAQLYAVVSHGRPLDRGSSALH
jgi:hypothetical protein